MSSDNKRKFMCINDDRRIGIDRRELTYDWYIPERRIDGDRRQDREKQQDSHKAWRLMRRYA